ncbi:MAG: S8 family serine peptidase [Verrucomicrobiae bacterium]|nr:S8 family serine peptidase [Verrucomicrobiae bacterium]
MRFSRRDQLALLIFATVCVLLSWRAHDRGWLRSAPTSGTPAPAHPAAVTQPLAVTSPAPAALTAPSIPPVAAVPKWVPIHSLPAGVAPRFTDTEITNRLRNTAASMKELLINERAVLLRNALVDTASGEPLPIPAALRSQAPAEAWIVQSGGPITPAFRAAIAAAGAEVLSYVPNNALLVRASAEAADQLAVASGTAAILPLEPYFKLTPGLLDLALSGGSLAEGQQLILTIPGATGDLPELAALGVREVRRERGPFGTLVTVEPPADALAAIAALPSVHRIEPRRGVRFANDLTGYSLGSTTVSDNTDSFEDLDGDGVLVNVNDSGVDAKQPDLVDRVYTIAGQTQILMDPDGHGTHVAGIIAGDGTKSDTINQQPDGPPTGSVTNANFKGKAPKASLFVLPVDLLYGPASGDTFLQETAAQAPERFNSPEDVLISNNSWGYAGLDEFEYSSHSASYDAAVRDALPQQTGDQPILYVFSAGNSGSGGNNGVGGVPGTIISPGNAKNVVTVGALESLRPFTNAIIYDTNAEPVQIGALVIKPGWQTNAGPYYTNQALLPMADSDWQVAFYSSRGNVGIGIEGANGRLKPDVVAGGSFVISTRSEQWEPAPLPPRDDPFFPEAYLFDEINQEVLPNYRYELGTSMSAPAISGLLAQLQQYFEQEVNQFPSSAAYKALLINAARFTSPTYAVSQDTVVNYTGWGRPELQRALRRGFRTSIGGSQEDVIGIDAVNGIATGESMDLVIGLVATNALEVPLRMTLVWTDPPGDPLVGPKLVNDLNLIVSNTLTGEIYWGNDFDPESGFSRAHTTNEITTNGLPTLDRINNVEQVILPPPLFTNYVLTVVGHRVNVNSVRTSPSNIVQDFALTFSSDLDPADTNTIGVLEFPAAISPIALGFVRPSIGTLTNSLPLLNQRAGANSPLVGGTNGSFKQWQFYIFTNGPATNGIGDVTFTNGSNVVFLTFPVGSLSRGRTNGPDVDLYVSRDPRLLDLNPDAVAAADKSTTREGSELLYYLNQPVSDDNVFYIGVKSEDHQAGEYGFVGLSTDEPLIQFDTFGNPQPFTIPLGRAIPDGTPANPGIQTYLAVSVLPQPMRGIRVSITKSHENFPDLLSQLSLNRANAVVHNHTLLNGLQGGTNQLVTYDDTGAGGNSVPSDGPGTTIDFLGYPGLGVWFLNTVDNALGNIGSVDNFTMTLLPNNFGEDFVKRCVNGGAISLEVIIVPPEASRLTVTIRNVDPPTSLEVFIRRDAFPDILDPANNDKYAQLPSNGGSVSLGTRDVPPLQAGRYFIAVYNPSFYVTCYEIRGQLERNLDASFTRTFETDDLGTIPDAGRRFATITVDDARPVTSMDVGLRVDHPRVSDLSVRLQNPRGDSAVIFEERGGETPNGLGTTVISTNLSYQHVALSFEPASRRAALYVNGARVAEQLVPAGFTPVTSNQFLFGLDPKYQYVNQEVQLDDFGLWRRALRPQEIRDIYFRGLNGEAKQPADRNTGLFALWPFEGNGDEVLGPNRAALTDQVSAVPGAFPGDLGILIPSPGFGLVTNSLAMPRPGEFTLEGWVAVPATSTNAVIAGWWGDSTSGKFGPGLVSDGSQGLGSILGVLTDADGNQITIGARPGLLTPGGLVTNTLFATFSENTNRVSEKIKFVPPPFAGQLEEEQLLSLDDFEQIQPDVYPADESFLGWQTVSNAVEVVQDSLIAYRDGLNYLALSNGVVRRSFNSAVGERYRVTFVARLSPEETNDISSAVSVLVDGVAVTAGKPLDANPAGWQTNTFDIRATGASVVLEFNGGASPTNSPGLLVDDVAFFQTDGTATYLPEEDIKALMGAGQGTWLLELNDHRTPFIGDLLGWQLTLTFAPTSAPAIRLTNGIPYFTNVTAGLPQYFYIDIPLEASTTTNLLQSIDGAPLALWYNPQGLPGEGTLPEDASLIYPTMGTVFNYSVLNTNLPPLLVPGQRYYLSVENLDPNTTHPFAVQVDFGVNIIPLTNGVPYAATNLNNGLFDYYSFEVSSNGLGASFILTNFTKDLNLVVRKGQLPTRTQYDYASTNSGIQTEIVNIDLASLPVPLSPGIWYLGVYSADPGPPPLEPIPYTILATESSGNLVPLANGIPTLATITNANEVAYFYLDITEDPAFGSFVVTNMTSDVSLYVRKGLPLPSPGDYHYASIQPGLTAEEVILTPGSQPVPLSPGRWFVTVVPEAATPVNFTVIGSYVPSTVAIIPLTNAVPYVFASAPATNVVYFSFESPTVPALLFEIYGLTGEATLRVSKGVLPPFADPADIFSFPQQGSLGERVAVRTNQVPDPAGIWFLEVAVESLEPVDFTVRAAIQQDGLLQSGAPFLGTVVLEEPPQLIFDTVPGELYRIFYSDDLATPLRLWIPVDVPLGSGTRLLTAPGDVLTVELPAAPADNVRRFYYIEQVPQQ